VLENAAGNDLVSINVEMQLSVLENASGADSISAVLFWEQINTSQTANWTEITT
jgi:hypothetical protein